MSASSLEKDATLQRIKDLGLIAVIRGPSAELTLKMVDALVAGGVRGIEITYSTPEAAWVVRQISERYGEEILPGMGTLTRPEQVQEAQQAGASACFCYVLHRAAAIYVKPFYKRKIFFYRFCRLPEIFGIASEELDSSVFFHFA